MRKKSTVLAKTRFESVAREVVVQDCEPDQQEFTIKNSELLDKDKVASAKQSIMESLFESRATYKYSKLQETALLSDKLRKDSTFSANNKDQEEV